MAVREYNGQRVVTFKDIDTVHGRPNGTAGRNFRANKVHFIEGVDFFKISPDEFRRAFGAMDKRQQNDVTLLTESGYLMLAKSFTDDLAWTVQRELVNSYFRVKAEKLAPKPVKYEQLKLETAEYHYFDKKWNGEPVVTLEDIHHFTGVNPATAYSFFMRSCTPFLDFCVMKKKILSEFKRENPAVPRNLSVLTVVTKSGFEAFVKNYKPAGNVPECFEEKPKFMPVKEPSDAMKSLVGHVKRELGYIEAVSTLLLMPDTKENHELYRRALTRKMRELNHYKLDVESIII